MRESALAAADQYSMENMVENMAQGIMASLGLTSFPGKANS
jgi:hypothetical protein